MGGDEFLGQISLPLQDFDVYEKPRARSKSLKIFNIKLTFFFSAPVGTHCYANLVKIKLITGESWR